MTPKPQREKSEPATMCQIEANTDNSTSEYASINAANNHEEIARLAYQYYIERGEEEGYAEEDWYRAENEIRRRRGQ